MNKPTNIKETTPNSALIEQLEKTLEQARSGDLRSMVFVKGWNDDRSYHEWIIDERSSNTKMLGAVQLALTGLSIKVSMHDSDSAFVRAVKEITEI